MKPLAEHIYEEIEQTLLHYRHSKLMCEDGDSHYPLTDLLTPDNESIQFGYDEIRMICDAIYNRVLTKHFISAEKTPEALIEETWDAMPGGHDGFLKTWGFIQFGKRLIEKVLPRPTTRKPRGWIRLGRTGASTAITDNEYTRDQWLRVGDRVRPLYTEMTDEPVEPESMDVMRAEFEEWHTLHFIEPLTRSSGGSDYRDNHVIRRWEAWQGARTQRPGADAQLLKFYDAKTTSELIQMMERHILKLQERVPKTPNMFTLSPRQG
jgi:hypothetical protein